MTPIDDLIKRLRQRTQTIWRGGWTNVPDAECHEAADALQRMKDALEPFAKLADYLDHPLLKDKVNPESMYSKFMAARRALRG